MKPRLPLLLVALAAFAAGALVTGRAFSQDGQKPAHVQQGEAMYRKIFETMAKKGPQHAWLAKRAGTWVGTARVQTTFSPEPLEYAWTSTTTLSADGRFADTSIDGEFVGAAFEGHGVLGYDNQKKTFVHVVYSNLGTGIEHLTGQRDEETNTLTLTGEATTFEWQGMKMDYTPRIVLTYHDDDSYTYQRFADYASGMQLKEVECRFTREKSD